MLTAAIGDLVLGECGKEASRRKKLQPSQAAGSTRNVLGPHPKINDFYGLNLVVKKHSRVRF